MPDGTDQFQISLSESLLDIPSHEWDACAGTDNPFLCHAFLSALEESGSVAAQAGWAPRHVLIHDETGQLVACAPLYLKGNSSGEYVFDWNWAEAYQRAGGDYYPKLLCAVPFTPVTGPRLLVREGLSAPVADQLKRQLISAMASIAKSANLSSVHLNFLIEDDQAVCEDIGMLARVGLQYHWTNDGYESYDDFLSALSSRKRKALKKERREAQKDVEIERLSGADIQPHHWDAMYRFYMDTGARKWGQPYLNRTFFDLLGERLSDKVVLIMANQDGETVAGALNLLGSDALYGRYWGCSKDIRYLHFELCYHQAIDEAIARGLKRVEAGAQGEHKIARGYLPTLTHSAHFIRDANFSDAIKDFLIHERQAIEHEFKLLMEDSPYKKG